MLLKQLTIPLFDFRLQQSVSDSKLNNIQIKKTEVYDKKKRKINQEIVQVVKKVKVLHTDSEEEEDEDTRSEEEDDEDRSSEKKKEKD